MAADIAPFAFGVAAGAIAVLLPWIQGPLKKYVLNCGKTTCPHHGADNTKRINDVNDHHRNGPTRPDIR